VHSNICSKLNTSSNAIMSLVLRLGAEDQRKWKKHTKIHHNHCRVAGEAVASLHHHVHGRQHASRALQSDVSSWSSHLFRGRPGGRLQVILHKYWRYLFNYVIVENAKYFLEFLSWNCRLFFIVQ